MPGLHDINGLAWRGDGLLVGLDREGNRLITIDPATAVTATLAALSPAVGAVGGMTILDGVGYFATGSTQPQFPGSDELWTFDLFTGAHELVAALPAGTNVMSLAAVPEPANGVLLLVACAAAAMRRRRVTPKQRRHEPTYFPRQSVR